MTYAFLFSLYDLPDDGRIHVMDPELERALRALDEAAEFAKSYRFEMTEDYLALLAQVEALPQNRSGADKSWVWRLLDSSARFYKSAVRVR